VSIKHPTRPKGLASASASAGASAATLAHPFAELVDVKADYLRNRAVFIDGHRMATMLTGLGASAKDFEPIRQLGQGLPADPTLPFRKSKNGRFYFDAERRTIDRLEFQPFILSAEENFVRHDSGQVRRFAEIDDDLQQNSVLQALLRFKAFMVDSLDIAHRPKLDYTSRSWVCTLFHLRTVTTPDLLGEPALEGVHSDGVDHTMTTLLASENMTDDSAMTSIHDMRERNGIRWNEVAPELVVGRHQHRAFLDTLLVVDHEFKHSLSPVKAVDARRTSTRDMLVFFTRKRTTAGHPSFPYDSLRRHSLLPMSIELGRRNTDRCGSSPRWTGCSSSTSGWVG
jgi:hypothetical protein